jgi:hypothetical protein
LTTANNAARHKKHTHNNVEAPLPFPFSPSSLLKMALQKALSKSMAHLCVLIFSSSFSTLTGEAAALLSKSKLLDDEPVSWSCRIL